MNRSSGSAPKSGSIPLARPDVPTPESAPGIARPLASALSALDRVVDRLYGSRWNPIDQSGPLAITLMLVVIATGVYLLLVYRIGAPYESMQRIQADVFLGRWLRALHRYASDLAVVFVALHVLRMLAAGKTWGPRVLAWVTGLFLVATLLVIGWTGYVLVWDAHGLLLGAAGARLMDALGLLATPVGRAFSGVAPAPPSFFFLNLFLHMSLPLGMTLLLWVHTLRLARSRWLAERPVWIAATAALVILSILVPAPLGPGADGLVLGDRASYDLFFTGWVPLAQALPAGMAWAALVVLALVPLSIPAWWRPARSRRPEVARHNPRACTGCGQCVTDCPFEAISMVPHPDGPARHEVASVNAARCVGCGLCAGSCDQLAIGPPSRDGHAQVFAVRGLPPVAEAGGFALISCRQAEVEAPLAAALEAAGHRIARVEVECAGNLHALTVAQLGAKHRGVFVLACPVRRCRSREGVELSFARLREGREPKLKHPLDPTRVCWASGSGADLATLATEFEHFVHDVGVRADASARPAGRARSGRERVVAVGVTFALLGLVAWGSQVPAGAMPGGGALRLAWRLPGQSWRDCTPIPPEEVARMPVHMRHREECRTVYLDYRLRAFVDGEIRIDRIVTPRGARGDRPLYVAEDLALAPGSHEVRIEFLPLSDPTDRALRLEFASPIIVEPGRARLLTLDDRSLALRFAP